MFKYDPLSLELNPFERLSNAFSQQSSFGDIGMNSNLFDNSIRRLSGESLSADIFDCGSSSGYGSPGPVITPLTSPDSNIFNNSILQQPSSNLYKSMHIANKGHQEPDFFKNLIDAIPAPSDYEYSFNKAPSNDLIDNCSFFTTTPDSLHNQMNDDIFKIEAEVAFKPIEQPTTDEPKVVASDDGFTMDEIAAFSRLLSSPKKAPPIKYQCHICYQNGHYISDCPSRFNSPFEELTPYQGRKKCYGEFQCQQCKRKWTSQNSVANEAQSCIKCHISVFPHKQLPVDKAVILGLIKGQKKNPTPSKIAPIGHGRPSH
uniref:Zf-3CxxC domain-containing protein n=1 Tax=Rhabditophanes sp. KR3021 TaxID=114890 RepID=A0AC35TL34_9BILA